MGTLSSLKEKLKGQTERSREWVGEYKETYKGWKQERKRKKTKREREKEKKLDRELKELERKERVAKKKSKIKKKKERIKKLKGPSMLEKIGGGILDIGASAGKMEFPALDLDMPLLDQPKKKKKRKLDPLW